MAETPDRPTSAAGANRLAGETSPYLLQHAHNPVDWYPWGEEAFAAARERDVPIFLSVGYSTCYWCHVMERESFEDSAAGRLLSERFVCVKVDREERPDVDDVYMAAVQLMTRSGGWPMSVWLTPPGARGPDDRGLEPFYAGTYFPPQPAHGRPSLTNVVEALARAWTEQRGQVLEQAATVTEGIRAHLSEDARPVRLSDVQIAQAVEALLRIHDETNGGFGGAPKFPQPVFVAFLIEVAEDVESDEQRERVEAAVRRTLDAMATGGIHDHVGGGFHRYSVDEAWRVPHFEKMLYDNGQLASLYARAFRAYRDPLDARVCADVCEYVLREMVTPEGTFASAQDAEVDAREGLNYLWRPEEIDALVEQGRLDAEDAAFAKRIFGLEGGPNFRDPHHPDEPPRNVLVLPKRPDELARELGMPSDAFDAQLDRVRGLLLAARAERKQPGLDDKVIVAWNGLMLAGLADTAAALAEPRYLDVAERCADRLFETLADEDGSVRRSARGGVVGPAPGYLEDHAMLLRGLLAMHHAAIALNRPREVHLARALRLAEATRARFGDGPLDAIMYDTLPDQSDLLVRTRSTSDGAMPAGVSAWIHGCVDLFEATGERRHLEQAIACLGAVSRSVRSAPVASIESTRALARLLAHDGSLPDKLGVEGDPDEDAIASPVRILAAADRVAVPADGAAELPIRLEIGDGYHVNAAEPGVEGLVGLRVDVARGTGVAAELAMPEPSAYAGGAIPEDMGTLRVHEGVVDGVVVVRRTAEAIEGRPVLLLTYQVCSDESCYTPLTVELDVVVAAI